MTKAANQKTPGDCTKVTNKKASISFSNPEYTRLNCQLIVETNGPLQEFITNDQILTTVNEKTTTQGLKFIALERIASDTLHFETNLSA